MAYMVVYMHKVVYTAEYIVYTHYVVFTAYESTFGLWDKRKGTLIVSETSSSLLSNNII